MDVVVVADAAAVGACAAALVSDAVARDSALVLGVATGATPLPVYRALTRGSADLTSVRLVALDEYVGLPPGHPASYTTYVRDEIATPWGIPWAQVVVPQGSGAGFEPRIAGLGGVDLQLLGIGRNGHLAFNEPGSPLASRTRVVELTESTRAANAAYVDGEVPTHAVTQGLATILEARRLVLLASGEDKADAVARALTGEVSVDCPASVLQRHPRVTVVLDEAAAARLGPGWPRDGLSDKVSPWMSA